MILLYGLMALLIPGTKPGSKRRYIRRQHPGCCVFHSGCPDLSIWFDVRHLPGAWTQRTLPEHDLAAVREGLTETAVYLEYQKLGQPYFYRLLTNSYSMSATDEQSSRYMKLFVYLPVAIRPTRKMHY